MENVNINELLREQRELQVKMESASEEEYKTLCREFDHNQREISIIKSQAEAAKNAPAAEGFSLTKNLRECLHGKKNQFEVRAALTASGLASKAVDVELQDILEPLYAKSALAELGVKFYKGMPMGDISIPVMGKGSVAWAGETAANSSDGTPTFGTNVVLKPKRLTAFFDISEMMLMQDTIGVEEALRREAVNALKDKFEATVLGNDAGSVTQPAGIFNGANLQDADTFAKVCGIEAGVEDANVYGEMKYLLSTKAKADFRAMAKSSKNTQLVMEGGAIDGVPAVVTSNVANGTKGIYAYGDFSNLAVAVWNELIFKVDDSVAYANGTIRIYVSAYLDAKVLRPAAFAFGNTRPSAQ